MDIVQPNRPGPSQHGRRATAAAGLLVALLIAVCPGLAEKAEAADGQPAVLILDQSAGLSAYQEIIAHLRTTVLAEAKTPPVFYSESLDLSRFASEDHSRILDAYVRGKFRDIGIDVIVALGARALDFAKTLRRSEGWSDLPVVFAVVPDRAFKQLEFPPNVTGQTVRLSLMNAVVAAKALVPGLKRVAMVGDRIESQTFRFPLAEELPAVRSQVELLDFTGLPMRELTERVAALPNDAAIIYTSINIDGDGRVFAPADALMEIAKAANRPIVVDIESHVGRGATGGFVLVPSQVGRQAGLLTARVLGGESAAAIPVSVADVIRPVFDWRLLQKWSVSENDLPAGSEIRFREPSMWQQYRWRVIVVAAFMLLQTALIFGLLYEDRRRRIMEASHQTLLGELGHVNRIATAGELTASIAHEIRQPLATIVSAGSAGLNWLSAKTPDLQEVRLNLQTIVNAGHRADGVLKTIRAIFRHEAPAHVRLSINDLIRDVLALTVRKIEAEQIVLRTDLKRDPEPEVRGDPIQLQQVLLNLIVNAVEAMSTDSTKGHELLIRSTDMAGCAIITVHDTGVGIAADTIDRIFDAFVTTKAGGMGLGLTICRSIVESHGGRISVAAAAGRGMVFTVSLPLAEGQSQ
jgi:signal transduction histidine kinase